MISIYNIINIKLFIIYNNTELFLLVLKNKSFERWSLVIKYQKEIKWNHQYKEKNFPENTVDFPNTETKTQQEINPKWL